MRLTNGRGVDCVLNSLSGEAPSQTWRCVVPFGTFVEIGLKDILGHNELDMLPFLQNTSFACVNLDHMIQNPSLVARATDGAFDFIRKGITRVVSPLTAYPITQVEKAFRLMQAGNDIGKMVLSFNAEDRA
jgi:NADPH:quinone reductase-like Zn-dependent oxidoreductase